jgi:hypothetical protein
MVPPFLAYYGVVNDNSSLIQEAYTQCELYRRYLRTPETGLWRHIIWGTSPDDGLWATGAFERRFERGGRVAHGRDVVQETDGQQRACSGSLLPS